MKFNKTQRIILRIFGVLALVLAVFIFGNIAHYHKGSFLSPLLSLLASAACFVGASASD
jgi:hypothetical protein